MAQAVPISLYVTLETVKVAQCKVRRAGAAHVPGKGLGRGRGDGDLSRHPGDGQGRAVKGAAASRAPAATPALGPGREPEPLAETCVVAGTSSQLA
jgi:hypothetical protein